MPMVVDAGDLAKACEAVMVCCIKATDPKGLRIVAQFPRNPPTHILDDGTDRERIRNMVLGLCVGLLNGPVVVNDVAEIGL